MREFYYDIGREYAGIKRIGLCSQLRYLNYFMCFAKAQGDVCYPRFTIHGSDYWNDFFEPGTTSHYDVTTSAETVIPWATTKENELWARWELYWRESPSNFQLSHRMREQAKSLSEGTEIGVHIRETDKHDDREVAFPTDLYVDRIKEVEGQVFCCSDCNHSIRIIMEHCPNAWCLPDTYRSDFFPIHKMVIDELSSSRSLLTEMSILMEMKEVWYGTYSGLISYLKAYSIPVVNLNDTLTDELKAVLAYYAWREKHLWHIIEHKAEYDWRGW